MVNQMMLTGKRKNITWKEIFSLNIYFLATV